MPRFLCTAIAYLLGTGMPMLGLVSLTGPEAFAMRSGRTLTFTERLAYERAIEEIYWRHRIWPKDNPTPKPSFEAIVSQRQIEQKVEDYLRKAQLVADHRGRQISASELQAEMDRIAQHTRRPAMLRELFAALDNDPFVIAECLARQTLTEQLIAHLTNGKDPGFAGGRPLFSARDSARPPVAPCQGAATLVVNSANAAYKVPKISTDCTDDNWTATTAVNPPEVRALQTALWTGSEMIVWGGYNFNDNQLNTLNTGGRYDPATDTWVRTSTTNAPVGRDLHTAVWTGSEMIVWGGYNYPALDLQTGGKYNPATDTWTATGTADAPVARRHHTAVWTGSEMVVWGGRNCCTWFNSGGRYNPSTDSWTATSTANAPEARWAHTAEWTGSEMIIWGGTNQTIYLNTGGRYDPKTDSWAATGVPNNVPGRVGHTSIWSGSEMMVWGGTDSTFNDCNTGGRYNPITDSWTATSIMNAPSPRDSLAAVWTGSEMIVWGGVFCCPGMDFNTGGRYNAGADTWTPTSTANAPLERWDHTAVWTGSEMIGWGGYNSELGIFLNTGGRYCVESSLTPTATPTATATATATATPTATPTPRVTPTPRIAPTPRSRPTPAPRP